MMNGPIDAEVEEFEIGDGYYVKYYNAHNLDITNEDKEREFPQIRTIVERCFSHRGDNEEMIASFFETHDRNEECPSNKKCTSFTITYNSDRVAVGFNIFKLTPLIWYQT